MNNTLLSLPKETISALANIEYQIDPDYSSAVYGEQLVISSRIVYSDHHQYEQSGRYYLIWVFDTSKGLELVEQFVFHNMSWDKFLLPCGIIDGKLLFLKKQAFHAYTEEEAPFLAREETMVQQAMQTNIGLVSLIETGSNFNRSQIIALKKDSNAEASYLNHLGASNNVHKICPDFAKSKATAIVDYIRMRGFDEEEKYLVIEQIVEVNAERLLIAVFHRKYKKNPATNTNKNSPFFYLFMDKSSGSIVGYLKFLKGLKPFKSTQFYSLEDSPYPGENTCVFLSGALLVYKSSKHIIFFDANGNINNSITLSGKKTAKLKALKLVGANRQALYLLDIKKGGIVELLIENALKNKVL